MGKTYFGSRNPNWKGGKSKCEICDKTLCDRQRVRCFFHRFTDEDRKKMSKARLGVPAWSKGKKRPDISEEKSHLWKGGVSQKK